MYKQIASNKRKSWLLIVLFIIIITAVGYTAGRFTEAGSSLVVVALVFSVFLSLVSYFSADKVALSVAGAQGPIEKAANPYVYRLVENLAITAGLPVPKIYIITSPALNAFATGRDPQHASVALTTGLIERLTNEELEGVMAHELAHIKNYDIRLMTLVVVLVGTVVLLSDYLFRWGLVFGHRRNEARSGGWLMLLGLLLLILSPLVAQLIKLAVSRRREFLADAAGALLTRYPAGLASALEKISSGPPLARASRATAHLYILSPLGGKAASGWAKLFATHPPVEQRLAALRSM